MFISNLSSIID